MFHLQYTTNYYWLKSNPRKKPSGSSGQAGSGMISRSTVDFKIVTFGKEKRILITLNNNITRVFWKELGV
jgi:hypothetical protein